MNLYLSQLILMSSELSMLDAGIVAAGIIYLSHKLMNRALDKSVLYQAFDTEDCLVKDCAMKVLMLLCKQNKGKLNACKRKYSQDKFMGVSSVKVSVKPI